jgi:hypothetical protein
LLNKKFITERVAEVSFSGFQICYSSYSVERLDDLNKALCYITGTEYNSIPRLRDVDSKPMPNLWYEWGFFDFKVFKKGTGHFKFKDEKVWEQLNRTYAKIKEQVLPEGIRSAA